MTTSKIIPSVIQLKELEELPSVIRKALNSSLDDIPGIGEKTKITLLKKYKSIKKIQEIPYEQIANEIGSSKAKKLMSFLNSSK